MLPWSALPLSTIGIIIALSILIPILLTIILIKSKRYEELGWVIGIFLLILSSVTFAFLIPNEIVNKAVIPKDYIWEDQGDVYYWERNSVFLYEQAQSKAPSLFEKVFTKRSPIKENFTGKEVIHVTDFNSYENTALINDVIYDQNGEIFRVINGQEQVSEWYEIDTHLNSLRYVNVEGGRMGIPSNSQDTNVERVGWVESNGEKDGKENVVFVRDMKKIKTGYIDGIECDLWQSDISNKQIVWHGEPYICDETLTLTVHPKTGYIVHVHRHLVLSAHLSQFVAIYYPDLKNSRFINRFLKSNNPIGEAAELIYDTTDESQNIHINEIKSLDAQMTYYPIIICVPMFIIGLALVWRYGGRSYYWKRYKDFEIQKVVLADKEAKKQNNISKPLILKGRKSKKKIIAFSIVAILIISSIGYITFGPRDKNGDLEFPFSNELTYLEIPEEPPTPPGSTRAIDSGRHALLPGDEGVHKLAKREWWYFNMYFNSPASDLKGWSMIVSFNKMAPNDIRFLRRDNLFVILYDDKGTSYNFDILNNPRGTLKGSSPGVDVKFKNSWAKGTYPSWEIHIENAEKGLVVDLNFTSSFIPVWVEGKSSNLIIGKYLAGDYYVPQCDVKGTINLDNKDYTVYGIGYHDHVWEANIPRFISKGWDWLNLHFDNGWEMYLSKFMLRGLRDRYAGAVIISPDNRNIVEWVTFKLDYVETEPSKTIRSMYYPTKYHLEASRDDLFLELDITVSNVCEIVWKGARTGMFEGPCFATGNLSWSGNTVELNGFGMSEATRVKYLLGSLNIFEKLRERFPKLFSK